MRILMSWVGRTDLNAALDPQKGQGPLLSGLLAEEWDRSILLCNYPQADASHYPSWLKKHTTVPFDWRDQNLASPMDFEEITRVVMVTVDETLQKYPKAQLTFHVSPGTSVMAAVWMLLGKTRYTARLIHSSPQTGVQELNLPFDIAAEFVPNILASRDQQFVRLAAGLSEDDPAFEDIVGQSAAIKKAILTARLLAAHATPVLIEGPSGTGKELFARAIHHASPRSKGPLQVIHCGAIPSELVESELFGHKKGAFTGAVQDRKGAFLSAQKGALFLDELGELPPAAQVKLLRVLQEGEITPVGGDRSVKVDVRIIAATNRNLIQEVGEGRFREDLFYRLAVGYLSLPALQDREGDLTLLTDRLMKDICNSLNVQVELSPRARSCILRHSWPGNVRELRNTLTRAVMMQPDGTIDEEGMVAAILPRFHKTGDILGRTIAEGFDLQKTLDEVSIHYIQRALNQSGNRKSHAAKLLGFTNYQRLSDWMKRLDMEA